MIFCHQSINHTNHMMYFCMVIYIMTIFLYERYPKIKKSPQYIAGGLERIFVVRDHKMCCIYIWLWLAGCQNILGSPIFLFLRPKHMYSKSTHIKYIWKSFIFVLFGASTGLVLDLILKISSNSNSSSEPFGTERGLILKILPDSNSSPQNYPKLTPILLKSLI